MNVAMQGYMHEISNNQFCKLCTRFQTTSSASVEIMKSRGSFSGPLRSHQAIAKAHPTESEVVLPFCKNIAILQIRFLDEKSVLTYNITAACRDIPVMTAVGNSPLTSKTI